MMAGGSSSLKVLWAIPSMAAASHAETAALTYWRCQESMLTRRLATSATENTRHG